MKKSIRLVLFVSLILIWMHGSEIELYHNHTFNPKKYDYKYDKEQLVFNTNIIGWKKHRQRYSILPKKYFELYAEYLINSRKKIITESRKLEILKEMFELEKPYQKAELWLQDYDKYGFSPPDVPVNSFLGKLSGYKKKIKNRTREYGIYLTMKRGHNRKEAELLTDARMDINNVLEQKRNITTEQEKKIMAIFDKGIFDNEFISDYLSYLRERKKWNKIINFYEKYKSKYCTKKNMSKEKNPYLFAYTFELEFIRAYQRTGQIDKAKEAKEYYNKNRASHHKEIE